MFTQTQPTKDALPPRPTVVIVIGVSGCGKSTMGALLRFARAMGVRGCRLAAAGG